MGSSYYHSTAVSGGCTGGGMWMFELEGGRREILKTSDMNESKEKQKTGKETD